MHILLHTYVQASWKEKVVSRKEKVVSWKGKVVSWKEKVVSWKEKITINLKRGSGISEP